MVVHIGVVVVAIGLAAATSYLHRGQLHLAKGHTGSFAGHTVEFVRTRVVTSPSHSSYEAVLRIDDGGLFYPAVSQFGAGTATVGTPAIDSSWTNDLYLSIATNPNGAVWSFGVVEQPLVMWLWVGAGIIGFGSLLSAIPGRRRRPTDPVSAPVIEAAPPVPTGGTPPVAGPEDRPEVETDPLPVGAGDPS
jgi:cytochrome c-type biogenesis protein CcmF